MAAITFVILPCITALVFGWAIRHWVVAAAAAVGAYGVLALAVSPLWTPDVRPFIPLVTGGIVAGTALTLLLFFRPSAAARGRISAAFLTVFGTHITYTFFAIAQA